MQGRRKEQSGAVAEEKVRAGTRPPARRSMGQRAREREREKAPCAVVVAVAVKV